MSEYYLSIVATSRNDNHGGDLNKRTSAFLSSIYYQAKRTKLKVEVILVEWNPPQDKALLNEVLPKATDNEFVSLKYIIVPKEIHNSYPNSPKIPLYQMIAKNVGIKRAKGEFILCTNIDIIFSNECFDEFAKKDLKANNFYRANRCDIPSDVLNIENEEERLEYGRNSILKRIGKTQGHEAIFLFPFFKSIIYKFTRISFILNRILLFLWKKSNKGEFPFFIIDFDACGDFTLMSKQDWIDIEGYNELDMYSIHIDSMALWAACALGKKQQIFSQEKCIYHIYHEDGWESKDVLKTIRFLENKPCLDYSIVHKGGLQIVKEKSTWKINTDNWGLVNYNLKEVTF